MRPSFKTLVALTAGVALVVLSAAPSAAQTGTITGGTVTINATLVPNSIALGSSTSTDPSCSETLDITMDDHTASGTSTGHAAIVLRIPFVHLGGNYMWSLSYSSSAVAITHTTTSGHTVAISSFIVTDFNLYNTANTGSCTPSTAKCGNMDMNFTGGLTGTYTGTISSTPPHDLSASSTVDLAGVGNISAAGCTPPFSAYNGKVATVSGLTAHF